MVYIPGPERASLPKGEAATRNLLEKLSEDNQNLVVSVLRHLESLASAGSRAAKEAAEQALFNTLLNVPKVRKQIIDTAMGCLNANKIVHIKVREVDEKGKTTGWIIVEKETPDHRTRLEAMRELARILKPKPEPSQKGQPYFDDEEQQSPSDFMTDRRQAQGA